MASPRPLLGALAAVVVGVGWMGCATDNGDPVPGGEEPSPTTSSTTGKDSGTRPVFEAGFPDAPDPDPTPDGGDTCIDKDDQGSTETTAKALPDTSDADNSVKTVNAVLNGPVDVDFFKFHMADEFGSSVQADFQIQTAGVEMCVFVKCDGGETTVSSCTGGVLKTSDIGTKGCCATGPSQVTPNWDCPGITDNDSASFFVRLKQTQDKCTSYSWSYRF